jgi:uncharacterized membrane protein
VSGDVMETVAERAQGGRPGRLRSLLVALVVAVAGAVLVYKGLRSAPGADADTG